MTIVDMIRLPWCGHAHVQVRAEVVDNGAGGDVVETQWDGFFDAVAEAAHDLDEEVMCSGSLRDRPYAVVDVLGYGLSPAAVDQLAVRVERAATCQAWGAETSVKRRCRCR